MLLQSIQAVAHPDGNRIDLSWQLDASVTVDGVRVVRRQGRYPQHADDGTIVSDVPVNSGYTSDLALTAEHYYYYSLFPYSGSPAVYDYDNAGHAAAMPTAPNGYADYMLGLLPALYHRYDKDAGYLARFLQIAGGQIDQFHSLAAFTRTLRKLEQAPGELLPLLAQWIGWKTDYKRDLNRQRDEIRYAPSIYRRIGLLPTLEATIKRISSWDSRSKEYVHNVFASNRPPRLNLWSRVRDGSGVWATDETLMSLDYAYDGRPAYTADVNGLRWLFYHTQRKGRWEIWSKVTPFVVLDIALLAELSPGQLSGNLWQALAEAGLSVAQTAQLNNIDTRVWGLVDGSLHFIIEQLDTRLLVYDLTANAISFGASRPEVADTSINKHPSAATQGDSLWLCWTRYDETTAQWSVVLRRRSNAQWSETGPEPADGAASNPFIDSGTYDATRPRRRAVIVSDDSGGVWLFWQEHNGHIWQLRYNRHDGANWGTPVTLPLDGGDDPRVQDDIQVVMSPSSPNPRIYLFWSRQRGVASAGGKRWQVALRVKTDQTVDAGNWSNSHVLPKAVADNHHDREPFAFLNAAAELEVFWSSNRDDSGWSIWRSTLLDYMADSWSTAECITGQVYLQRTPLVLPLPSGIGLVYHSNRNRVYNSTVYRASEMYDERYAGSVSVDLRHQQQIRLHDTFEDPQRYSYDIGQDGKRDDNDRIARDTVGAFLRTDTLSDQQVNDGIARLRRVVREFMPLTDRAVFIPDKTVQTEYIYSYDLPPGSASHYIESGYSDDWISTASASALAEDEDFTATLES